ncbi:MAG: FecR domain-containing protein [Anaeromyxobacter sp.]|nr:FecR domain-containing protein [Anaeromyxobacter sp.]MBL0277613.1 FecR domain-containing protein [Anaeromyxobacter sp.]
MTARARATAVAALAALALGAAAVHAEEPAPAGAITFLAGQATRLQGGARQPLALGSAVFQGDVIETARRTRLELRLSDQSVLRLGPLSKVELDAAAFGASPDDRKVSAKLRVGNVWANVTKALGGEARFEVKTENAVAGVRGTTFRVDASKDRSVVVRVYSGTVAVAAGPIPRPAHAGAPDPAARREVAGPQEVTREQWERLVTELMQVRVAADGTPAEPERFALAAQDEWETWNRQRDAAAR